MGEEGGKDEPSGPVDDRLLRQGRGWYAEARERSRRDEEEVSRWRRRCETGREDGGGAWLSFGGGDGDGGGDGGGGGD